MPSVSRVQRRPVVDVETGVGRYRRRTGHVFVSAAARAQGSAPTLLSSGRPFRGKTSGPPGRARSPGAGSATPRRPRRHRPCRTRSPAPGGRNGRGGDSAVAASRIACIRALRARHGGAKARGAAGQRGGVFVVAADAFRDFRRHALRQGHLHFGHIGNRQMIAQAARRLRQQRRDQVPHEVVRRGTRLVEAAALRQHLLLERLVEEQPLLGRQRGDEVDAARSRSSSPSGRTTRVVADSRMLSQYDSVDISGVAFGDALASRPPASGFFGAFSDDSSVSCTWRSRWRQKVSSRKPVGELAAQRPVEDLQGRHAVLGQALAREGGEMVHEDAQLPLRPGAEPAEAAARDAALHGALQLFLGLLGSAACLSSRAGWRLGGVFDEAERRLNMASATATRRPGYSIRAWADSARRIVHSAASLPAADSRARVSLLLRCATVALPAAGRLHPTSRATRGHRARAQAPGSSCATACWACSSRPDSSRVSRSPGLPPISSPARSAQAIRQGIGVEGGVGRTRALVASNSALA